MVCWKYLKSLILNPCVWVHFFWQAAVQHADMFTEFGAVMAVEQDPISIGTSHMPIARAHSSFTGAQLA